MKILVTERNYPVAENPSLDRSGIILQNMLSMVRKKGTLVKLYVDTFSEVKT